MNTSEIIKNNFSENIETNKACIDKILPSIEESVDRIIMMLEASGKLLSCGNGGETLSI